MDTINIIGLTLNVIGVIILFIWSNPQPHLSQGISIGLEDGTFLTEVGMTVGEYDKIVEKKYKRYKVLSKLGLGIILIGFIFQLWASIK